MAWIRRAAVVAALLAAAATASAGGPPWISVESPCDPINHLSPDAVLLVRTYSCGMPTDARLTATAEGLVNGERRSVPLELKQGTEKGVYAVKPQWPAEGTWVLHFTMSIGGEVSAIVTLDKHARVTDTQVVHRRTSAGDVDSVLRAAARGERHAIAANADVDPATKAAGLVGAVLLLGGATASVALIRGRIS